MSANANTSIFSGKGPFSVCPGDYARFLDIIQGPYFKSAGYKNFTVKSMMVTNTKFTDRILDYARCVGTELLGWNYPRTGGWSIL